jgi:hypothetical protein
LNFDDYENRKGKSSTFAPMLKAFQLNLRHDYFSRDAEEIAHSVVITFDITKNHFARCNYNAMCTAIHLGKGVPDRPRPEVFVEKIT